MAEVEQNHGHKKRVWIFAGKLLEINSDENVYCVFLKWENTLFLLKNAENWKASKKKV